MGRKVNHVVDLDPLIASAYGIPDGLQFGRDPAAFTLDYRPGNDIAAGPCEVYLNAVF